MIPVTGKSEAWADTGTGFPRASLSSVLLPGQCRLEAWLRRLQDARVLATPTVKERSLRAGGDVPRSPARPVAVSHRSELGYISIMISEGTPSE